jgi:AcrR family transcriptional regulator
LTPCIRTVSIYLVTSFPWPRSSRRARTSAWWPATRSVPANGILAAALKEFSAKGLAGARVDQIARRARINKRMLYHYFGSKDGLFTAIMRRKLAARAAWASAAPDDPGETLTHWFTLACEDVDWVRLMEWEALSVGDGPVLSEAERRRAFESGVTKLRAMQAKGLLPKELDPRHLLLSMLALTTFPLAFPQFHAARDGPEPA